MITIIQITEFIISWLSEIPSRMVSTASKQIQGLQSKDPLYQGIDDVRIVCMYSTRITCATAHFLSLPEARVRMAKEAATKDRGETISDPVDPISKSKFSNFETGRYFEAKIIPRLSQFLIAPIPHFETWPIFRLCEEPRDRIETRYLCAIGNRRNQRELEVAEVGGGRYLAARGFHFPRCTRWRDYFWNR